MCFVTIDGSQGEGGGQILRTSLALSLISGQPLRIQNIRARRKRPGLLRQHLTAVRAAAEVGQGSGLEGAEFHSTELTFRPGQVRAGEFQFAIGSAGSTTLVLQTVLPPLLTAPGPSRVTVEGGTHNPMAPPFEFLALAFLPLLGRMGARVEISLERHGFYPAGGGRVRLEVSPPASGGLQPIDLFERGEPVRRRARAVVANLPRTVGEREVQQVQRRLGWSDDELQVDEVASDGPGNALFLEVQCEHLTEVFTGFGEKGVRSERVADQAVWSLRRYLEAGVPVDEHLADQLLLPLALAGGGAFCTRPPSEHTRTNAAVIHAFLPEVRLTMERIKGDDWRVDVSRS